MPNPCVVDEVMERSEALKLHHKRSKFDQRQKIEERRRQAETRRRDGLFPVGVTLSDIKRVSPKCVIKKNV